MLVMTGLGISNGPKNNFEVAQPIGVESYYKILRITIPEVMPSIFIGVFMGFGVSFVGLISVEMLGVKTSLE